MFLLFVTCLILNFSCRKETKEVLLAFPEDITFNEIELDRFSFDFREDFRSGTEKSGFVRFSGKRLENGDFEGFAISNKNFRSYPWSLSYTFGNPQIQSSDRNDAIDSTVFSVFTNTPNRTENYLVGNARNKKAILKFDQPVTIEHILVANTTFGYLQTMFGSVYSGSLDPTTQEYLTSGTKIRNPFIPNTSTTMFGVFYLPSKRDKNLIRLSGFSILEKLKAAKLAKENALTTGASEIDAQKAYDIAYENTKVGQIRLIINGYLDGNFTSKIEHYLAVRLGVDKNNPNYNFTQNNWQSVLLESLGKIDELRFTMDGDYRDESGDLLSPQYFCVDGIRIKK